MLFLGLGPALAAEAGLRPRGFGVFREGELTFGELEPLVAYMQETPPEAMLPVLVGKLKQGKTSLKTLLSAGALANSRTFGGENYNGYHAFMAMIPAFEMAALLPKEKQALPLMKVLYRNATFMQDSGGREYEVLQEISDDQLAAIEAGATQPDGRAVRGAMRKLDVDAAEVHFARIYREGSPQEAYDQLQTVIHDDIDVHRIVLAERVWDILRFLGPQHAHTMLRTSVRHCVDVEERRQRRGKREPSLRRVLPRLLDQYELGGGTKGQKPASEADLERLANDIFAASADDGAACMAEALAEGFDPRDLGEALTLAANKLLLHDRGRKRGESGKPKGSVHGASVGVHASDAARAWRGVAATVSDEQVPATLIVGAYHTAGRSQRVGKDVFDYRSVKEDVKASDPKSLLRELDEAIRNGDQKRAVAVTECYEEANGKPQALFSTLLAHSIEPDGALHAEKYFWTTHTDFHDGHAAFRWRHAKGLARVCASQAGFEAPGLDQARELLGG